MAKRQPRDPHTIHTPSLPEEVHESATPGVLEPSFTLLARDRATPGTIRDWALRAARLGAPAEKLGTALIRSVACEEWQLRYGSKIPD